MVILVWYLNGHLTYLSEDAILIMKLYNFNNIDSLICKSIFFLRFGRRINSADQVIPLCPHISRQVFAASHFTPQPVVAHRLRHISRPQSARPPVLHADVGAGKSASFTDVFPPHARTCQMSWHTGTWIDR